MSLREEVKEAVAAAFAGIWINSYEQDNAINEISAGCNDHGWFTYVWDADTGIKGPPSRPEAQIKGGPDLITTLTGFRQLSTEKLNTRLVLVLRNPAPHFVAPDGRIINSNLLQIIQNSIESGGDNLHYLVILSNDSVRIPPDLEKMVYLIDHPLPEADEVWEIINSIVPDDTSKLKKPIPKREEEDGRRLLDAAAGLTRHEIAGAVGLALQRHKAVEVDTIWELKGKTLEKTGALEMLSSRPDDTDGKSLDGLGGLNALKEFCLQMFNSPNRSKLVRPQGVVLLGPGGVGKSEFSKRFGHDIGRPTVRLDVGSLMGGVVGLTEQNTRRAFCSIDAMAPLVLVIDEIERALAGSSGSLDSGVGARLMGSILTWLNDHTSDIFPVLTANSIEQLPPELFRAERLDGVFFLDLPGREQKDQVWDIYRRFYQIDPEHQRPEDDNWTPAEIKACCRLAVLLGKTLVAAAEQVVPVYNTAREKIEKLRDWADGRCLSADYRGVFDKNGPKKMLQPGEIRQIGERPKRKVSL